MAKKNLEEVLDKIANVKELRNDLNTEIHRYTVSAEAVLREIVFELNAAKNKNFIIPRELIKPVVEKYTADLYNRFGSTKSQAYTLTRIGNSSNFMVLIRPIPGKTGDIFASAIKSTRQKPLDNLKLDLRAAILKYWVDQKKNPSAGTRAQLQDTIFGNLSKSGSRIGGLLEVGHRSGGSVIEHELLEPRLQFQSTFNNLPVSQSRIAKKVIAELDFKMDAQIKGSILRDGRIIVSVYDQSKKENSAQSSTYERKLRDNFKKVVTRILKEADLGNMPGSPTPKEMLEARFHKEAAKRKLGHDPKKAALANKKFSSSAKKKIEVSSKESSSTERVSGLSVFVPEEADKPANNWTNLVPLINATLSNRIKQMMVAPRLVNRTGRFADSVRVVDVRETEKGYPSFGFRYDSTPYDVFDRFKGAPPWNTPDRNPRGLIFATLREMLREMAITRFFIRRIDG